MVQDMVEPSQDKGEGSIYRSWGGPIMENATALVDLRGKGKARMGYDGSQPFARQEVDPIESLKKLPPKTTIMEKKEEGSATNRSGLRCEGTVGHATVVG